VSIEPRGQPVSGLAAATVSYIFLIFVLTFKSQGNGRAHLAYNLIFNLTL